MNVQSVLQEIGVICVGVGHKHGRSGWINFDCPFCGRGSKKYHMGFNTAGKYTHCWKCGKHSLYDTFLELGIGKSTIRSVIAEIRPENALKEKKALGAEVRLPKRVGPLLGAHKRYLRRERHLDPDEMVRLWGLLGTGISSQLPWRIIVPILFQGRLCSWTSRAIGDQITKRYHSAMPHEEVICHKDLLLGEDYCRFSVIIHEGPFDVFSTGPGAVCTFGTTFSPAQILKLSKYSRRIVCYDSSPDAQERARKLVQQLSPFPGETFNVMLQTGKDTNEADEDEVEELRKLLL